MTQMDLISDHSKEKLLEVPQKLLEMTNLKMLFLEGNFLYKLPEDFFWKLPRLMWLDLRNNQLEGLPKSIANHEFLENLLLTNNNIKALPNELGLVPKLKALQVSENPLIYPGRKVIMEGTKAIKLYLKQEYEKSVAVPEASQENSNTDNQTKSIEEEEILIKVESFSTKEDSVQSSHKQGKSKKKKKSIKDVTEMVKKKIVEPHNLQSTLHTKKIPASDTAPKKQEEPLKIVHKISRTGSTIALTSRFDKIGVRNHNSKIADNTLREGWLNQLRILLTDQERILQQERNLRALSDWRLKKRSQTPKTFVDDGTIKMGPRLPPPPPFATYPEYAKMPTREELAAQLNLFFKDRGISKGGLEKGHTLNIDKLINDLVEQLKEMETTYIETRSPKSEMEKAGRQIKTITDIHKKLLRLKTSNDSTLV